MKKYLYNRNRVIKFATENPKQPAMKRTLLFLLVVFAAVGVQAQLRVLPNGTILTGHLLLNEGITGEVVPANNVVDDWDITTIDTAYNRDAAMHLFSTKTDGISFAAFGRGVTVGESALGKLRLNGYNGMEGVVRDNKVFSCLAGAFKFYRDVETTGVFVSSDSRLKTDIADLDPDRIADLSLLNPVSFRYKNQNQGVGNDILPQAETVSDIRFGFLAQDVKEIFPELVREGEDGNLSVDYMGLIPLMLAKINTLQSQIDAMNEGAQQAPASVAGIEGSVTFKLYQNAPNPFKSSTVIACDLPDNTADAAIRIYDLRGQQITVLPVRQRGHTSVTLSGESLRPGMYIYALIADGQEIDSKRMIITE